MDLTTQIDREHLDTAITIRKATREDAVRTDSRKAKIEN